VSTASCYHSRPELTPSNPFKSDGPGNLVRHQRGCPGLSDARKSNSAGIVVPENTDSSNSGKPFAFNQKRSWNEFALLVAEDARPLSLGESPRFKAYIRTLNPAATLPSARTVARSIRAMYVRGCAHVDNLLRVRHSSPLFRVRFRLLMH
jgi:hypothetical protein